MQIHQFRISTARRPSNSWMAPLLLAGATLIVCGAVLMAIAFSTILLVARGISRLIGRPFQRFFESAARPVVQAHPSSAPGAGSFSANPHWLKTRPGSQAGPTIDLYQDHSGTWKEDDER